MTEIIEMNEQAEQVFHSMYQAAREWDGKTHIVNQV
jgi:lipopolysaccharide biosynthesis regulator YciM